MTDLLRLPGVLMEYMLARIGRHMADRLLERREELAAEFAKHLVSELTAKLPDVTALPERLIPAGVAELLRHLPAELLKCIPFGMR